MPSKGGKSYGYEHRQARIKALAVMVEGTPCPLCGKPMSKRQALDLDHVIPLSMGGKMNGASRLSHSSCNRSRGASQGNKMRQIIGYVPKTPRRKLPKW